MGRKLVYVGFAYKHHKGTHAGYQHIKDILQYDHLIECHKEFEFLLINKGNVKIQLEGETIYLKSGEGIFINSGAISINLTVLLMILCCTIRKSAMCINSVISFSISAFS